MSKSLDNYIGISDSPFEKFEKSMKIPDDTLRQYFELATDLPTERINEIMNGDIREAHMLFAKELLKMYDDVSEFEEVKDRYLKIAQGGVPQDIPVFEVESNEINICDLLVQVGFATSKGEAKRMITGNGVKIDSIVQTNIQEIINLEKEKIVQFGKNKFVKVIKK